MTIFLRMALGPSIGVRALAVLGHGVARENGGLSAATATSASQCSSVSDFSSPPPRTSLFARDDDGAFDSDRSDPEFFRIIAPLRGSRAV